MEQEEKEKLQRELERLTAELAERNASIPIHSIRPHQLIEIEELEEEIEELKQRLAADT